MQRSKLTVQDLPVPIQGAAPAPTGLRIAHVSDFHFRRWNRVFQAAQDALLTLEFDFIVATGDYCTTPHRWTRPAELMRRFFGPLAERAPVYAVLGNHDHPDLAAANDLPVEFLGNRSVTIEHAGVVFELAGVDQTRIEGEDLTKALGGESRGSLTILLAHYPSTVFRLRPGRVDLQLSGHTHGGQIRPPYLGCVWTNDQIPCRMSRGLHVVRGTCLHISPGIGVSMPIPLRINCPPEVTVLTLATVDRPIGASDIRDAVATVAARIGPIA